jgi:hypothetical protein
MLLFPVFPTATLPEVSSSELIVLMLTQTLSGHSKAFVEVIVSLLSTGIVPP